MKARRRIGVSLTLTLALAQAALLSACSRSDTAETSREQSSEAKVAVPAQREASAVVPATHAAPAPAPADLSNSCRLICAASAKLDCPQAKACEANCMAMGSTGVCVPELGAFYSCLQKQPSERWECLEDGTAAIREGYCENEQASFVRCLHEK